MLLNMNRCNIATPFFLFCFVLFCLVGLAVKTANETTITTLGMTKIRTLAYLFNKDARV
jgi:hypothetical protein